MHEVGICEAILQVVEKRSAGRMVKRVCVQAGVNHHLVPDAMQQGFTMVAAGGPAEDASLDLEVVPAEAACDACNRSFQVVDFFAVCPACGSPSLSISENDSLVVKSIEYAAEPGSRALDQSPT